MPMTDDAPLRGWDSINQDLERAQEPAEVLALADEARAFIQLYLEAGPSSAERQAHAQTQLARLDAALARFQRQEAERSAEQRAKRSAERAARLQAMAARLEKRRASLRRESLYGSVDKLLAFTPSQFETAIADMLRSRGLKAVEVVGGGGDLGVDITARDQRGRSMVVQCKRYAQNRKVGTPELQQFIGMAHVHHKADLKLYVTTSDFTADARALALEHQISLMTGSDIVAELRRNS
jgi:restriction endonuclease Mrr